MPHQLINNPPPQRRKNGDKECQYRNPGGTAC
nr:MAG TPA: hypothetical protein [Caudoviricetes sp.]